MKIHNALRRLLSSLSSNIFKRILKKGGKRFELACYKNKVMEWRNKIETDLDEVLQINSVFNNVSKGEVARSEVLKKVFGDMTNEEIIKLILEKGDLQVGDKERKNQLSNLNKDICHIVSDKCINSTTNKPFPTSIIEKALLEIHFSVKPNQSAKKQALEAIKLLKEKNTIPIARAMMKIRITSSDKTGAKRLKQELKEYITEIESEGFSSYYEMICLIDPGSFKKITEYVQSIFKAKGEVEVISLKAVEDSDESF